MGLETCRVSCPAAQRVSGALTCRGEVVVIVVEVVEVVWCRSSSRLSRWCDVLWVEGRGRWKATNESKRLVGGLFGRGRGRRDVESHQRV